MWAQFTELSSYYKKQADDDVALNTKVAEMIALLTCSNNKSKARKSIKYTVTPDLKQVLNQLNSKIKNIYSNLPNNAMLIVCSGHGDSAIVRRYNFFTHTYIVFTYIGKNKSKHIFLK